jgi:hypothetical protein
MLEVQKYLKAKTKEGLSPFEAFSCLNADFGINVKHYEAEGVTLLSYDQINNQDMNLLIECKSLILQSCNFNVVSRKFARLINYIKCLAKIDEHLIGVYNLKGNWYISIRDMAFAEGLNEIGKSTIRDGVIKAFGFKSYDDFNTYFKKYLNDVTFIFEYRSECDKSMRLIDMTRRYTLEDAFEYADVCETASEMKYDGLNLTI